MLVVCLCSISRNSLAASFAQSLRLGTHGNRKHCPAAEYVEQQLASKLGKRGRTELWEAAVACSDTDVAQVVGKMCDTTGWARSSLAREMAAIYKQLSGAIHDEAFLQQSGTVADLVVPYPLQRKQAAALQCAAVAYGIPVRVMESEI